MEEKNKNNHQKRFSEWILVKEKVDNHKANPPLFKEGEIWWANIGENVGSEINGKGEMFFRPVIIYKKLCSQTFLAIPTSTKQKEGTWYVPFIFNEINEVALLSQIRIISYRRLGKRMGEISFKDMEKIKNGFKNLFF